MGASSSRDGWLTAKTQGTQSHRRHRAELPQIAQIDADPSHSIARLNRKGRKDHPSQSRAKASQFIAADDRGGVGVGRTATTCELSGRAERQRSSRPANSQARHAYGAPAPPIPVILSGARWVESKDPPRYRAKQRTTGMDQPSGDAAYVALRASRNSSTRWSDSLASNGNPTVTLSERVPPSESKGPPKQECC